MSTSIEFSRQKVDTQLLEICTFQSIPNLKWWIFDNLKYAKLQFWPNLTSWNVNFIKNCSTFWQENSNGAEIRPIWFDFLKNPPIQAKMYRLISNSKCSYPVKAVVIAANFGTLEEIARFGQLVSSIIQQVFWRMDHLCT